MNKKDTLFAKIPWKNSIFIGLMLLILSDFVFATNMTPLQNATENPGSIPNVMAYSFAYSWFGLILVILATGIAWVNTKKIVFGLLSGLVVSLILYALSPLLISINIIIGLVILLSLLAFAERSGQKPK